MPLPAYHRERIETPDGDFIDLDWVAEGTAISASPVSVAASASPLVVLFHGLEGSSASHYARALMHAVVAKGWQGVVVHFRGCSGEPNRLPRGYHSGDSAELAWILNTLNQRNANLHAVGVSLGGNVLLKYLGEQGPAAQMRSATAISVPYDLAAANRMLSRGFGLLYSRHFLRTLIPRTLSKAARFPGHVGLNQLDALRSARTLRDFDAAVTAPLHGFADAEDYYTQSSCSRFLKGITVPTLLLHAENDPFLPATAIPTATQLPESVTWQLSPHGGHVGFVSGNMPGHLSWLPQRILMHIEQSAGNNRMA